MSRGRRRVAPTAAGLALLSCLTGCAAGTGTAGGPVPSAVTTSTLPPARPSPSAQPAPTVSPTPSRDSLADLAEQQASLVPSADPGPATSAVGSDVSWPQCPKGLGIPQKLTLGLPGPLPSAAYVVIGLTNGPGFVANPCLADQVRGAAARGLPTAAYAVASFPDAATRTAYAAHGPFDGSTPGGALENVGYQQALFNVASLRAAHLHTPMVWIDIEPVPDFAWSTDTAANAAVVRGVARGYADAGFEVGVYSTPLLWRGVVGDLRLGLPEWRAAGPTSRAEALRRCGPDWSIQGGRPLLGQWVEGVRDLDVTCPGVTADGRILGYP